MFPLEYPLAELSEAQHDDLVLDPFCGRGTTLFAARLLGLGAVGIDADPVAAAIARAKLASCTADDVEHRAEELLGSVTQPESVPAGEFWDMAYHADTLVDVCRLREALLRVDHADCDVVLRALVLGILHGPQNVGVPTYLSNQMPRTFATKPRPAVAFWHRSGLRPRRVDVLAAIHRRARYVLQAIPVSVPGSIHEADSRHAGGLKISGPVRWIVTSPPYLGMRTYRPDQWLRHWFLGGTPDVDYSTTGMLPPGPRDAFVTGLADVWRSVAGFAAPGAQLSIRFGALPSVPTDPEAVLRDSLVHSKAGWRVVSVTSAGPATRGRRQAAHMRGAGAAVDEIDLRARLAA